MKIRPKNPINASTSVEASEKFTSTLHDFVNELENKSWLNPDLKDKLISYGADENELNKMIEEVRTFSPEDEEKEDVNFNYNAWIERLLK